MDPSAKPRAMDAHPETLDGLRRRDFMKLTASAVAAIQAVAGLGPGLAAALADAATAAQLTTEQKAAFVAAINLVVDGSAVGTEAAAPLEDWWAKWDHETRTAVADALRELARTGDGGFAVHSQDRQGADVRSVLEAAKGAPDFRLADDVQAEVSRTADAAKALAFGPSAVRTPLPRPGETPPRPKDVPANGRLPAGRQPSATETRANAVISALTLAHSAATDQSALGHDGIPI